MRHTILKSAALVAAIASLAGSAGASEALAPAAPAPPAPADPHAHAAQPAGAADTAQVATLGVLRRARQTSDAVPDAVRSHIAQAMGPDVGANPDLARRALRTSLGEDLYVVPGRGWVCLASSGGAAGCTPTDQIDQGYAVTLQRIPSGVRLGGLVPDGVSTVTIRGGAGETATATAEGNAWRADVAFDPASVAWTRAGDRAEVSVPVSVPPPEPTADAG
ncbi:MAG TPA: hypothetical protein VFG42_21095 [Baekduia sp.]|uniref:hypothetical protein n=1 Tax=Baekduia sp. TaxID=2600305 RepID=UPI002D77A662|nr:hypothetical protein [Baekduia sp.]HET6509307.1 hypothetical protein [Baekduia sp.]